MDYLEEYVEINGIKEYMLHCQAASEAPVILFLHGGPGQSESSLAYYMDKYRIAEYTIVFYDQRGTGRTCLKNRKSLPDMNSLSEDLMQTVLYIKEKYQKNKIILMGHSWGSVLGSLFTLNHPEHVLCYIGIGQVINMKENERIGYLKLKHAIEEYGNRKDMNRLCHYSNYPPAEYNRDTLKQLGTIRKIQGKYGLAFKIDTKLLKIFINSPHFRLKDILPMPLSFLINKRVMEKLWYFNLEDCEPIYHVPVYYLLGEKDNQTPVELSINYFNKITAPDKLLLLVSNAGHVPMIDNREEFAAKLNELLIRLKLFNQLT